MEPEDINLRKDMLEALGSIEDPGQRIVLMLLLRSMDDISRKLDKVLSDEAKIKHIVLNGHSEAHDAHHKWIDTQLPKTNDIEHAVTFVKNRIDNKGLCSYATRKLKEEEDNSASKRKIGESIVEKILYAILVFLVGVVFSSHFGIKLS
jgi:hypothetical protein